MQNKLKKDIKVAELFAGVGGFRIGLEGWEGKSSISGFQKSLKSPYRIVWSNQWEPATKTQHASIVYEERWGKEGHSNEDIASVNVDNIPDFDMLVGGFPCQDYSVATTLKNSKGLIGKKGVLWWSIHKILVEKEVKPNYLFLENVDRLLKSPSTQRGRDFAVILQSLNQLGYIVEWRVINAADYGFPQRRRRTYILAYHSESPLFEKIMKVGAIEWMLERGTLASAFPSQPVDAKRIKSFKLKGDLVKISNDFDSRIGAFENAGIMIGGEVKTIGSTPFYDGEFMLLRNVVLNDKEVDDSFYIPKDEIDKWEYLKGSKNESRESIHGFSYRYSEGAMSFPDSLDKASRTIITGEGGKSPSRFKHVIVNGGNYRRLTPIELERLNMFPDNHTKHASVSDTKRAFLMGNALVVGVIEKIGQALAKEINE